MSTCVLQGKTCVFYRKPQQRPKSRQACSEPLSLAKTTTNAQITRLNAETPALEVPVQEVELSGIFGGNGWWTDFTSSVDRGMQPLCWTPSTAVGQPCQCPWTAEGIKLENDEQIKRAGGTTQCKPPAWSDDIGREISRFQAFTYAWWDTKPFVGT
ncbi:hypothetical protein N7494_013177 [Penicillium frequentans]|uniref:Uncharacterized protein n=1 Tax=Penicillium frequentans TaxID=3151616 RepID=A0AAD6CHR1_9EURO|nr:hypothetical protein N7494_013177 [Penicillium glabrum]